MRLTAILLAACLLAVPAAAQDGDGAEPPAESGEDDGFSLMEEGARLIMRGLLEEMGPALDEMRGFADEVEPALRDFVLQMGPALQELARRIDDFSNYEPPEFLPNGDIIIRRKQDAPDFDPGEEIEI